MSKEKPDWPRDEQGKRTDPIGRYIESLPPEGKRAVASTCATDFMDWVIAHRLEKGQG